MKQCWFHFRDQFSQGAWEKWLVNMSDSKASLHDDPFAPWFYWEIHTSFRRGTPSSLSAFLVMVPESLLSFLLSLLHPSLIHCKCTVPPQTPASFHIYPLHFCFHQFLRVPLPTAALHSFFRTHSFALFFVRLLNLRAICCAPPPPPPFPPTLHSSSLPCSSSVSPSTPLPLSSGLSPLYKDSHWRTWAFCSSHILPLILLSCCSMRRGGQLKSVFSPPPCRCSARWVSALRLSGVTN